MSKDQSEPTTDSNLLARIDERTRILIEKVQLIETKLENHYVSQEEFRPVKSVVYGMVGVILLGVVGSLLYLVIK